MEEQLQQIKNDSGNYQIFAGKLKYSKNFPQLLEYLHQKYSFLTNSYNNAPNKLYFYFYFLSSVLNIFTQKFYAGSNFVRYFVLAVIFCKQIAL